MSSCERHREELKYLFGSTLFANPVAVTLTMKKRAGGRALDPIAASENFRHFQNRLNRTVLGSRAKRHGARLLMIAVIETSADHRLHYHCVIDPSVSLRVRDVRCDRPRAVAKDWIRLSPDRHPGPGGFWLDGLHP